jgi:poly-gamma-glutamate biosynthesis protein PgsC/CapC
MSIGVGLVVSLLFSELFGLVPGGLVVPGYIALYLNRPQDVLWTLVAALATFAIVHAASMVVILYGRRRTVLMILVGYLVGMGLRTLVAGYQGIFGEEFDVIGFIIPGLIAIWLDRQGVTETLSALVTISVMVRLVLVLVVGDDLKALA